MGSESTSKHDDQMAAYCSNRVTTSNGQAFLDCTDFGPVERT